MPCTKHHHVLCGIPQIYNYVLFLKSKISLSIGFIKKES